MITGLKKEIIKKERKTCQRFVKALQVVKPLWIGISL
jgi:hypothetical protein